MSPRLKMLPHMVLTVSVVPDDMSLPMGPKETPNEQYAPLNPENLAEKLANE